MLSVRSGVLMLMLVLVVSGCSSTTSPDDAPASPNSTSATLASTDTTDPTASTDTAGPTVDAAATDWSRVPHDESVFGGPDDQAMVDVVERGPGLVAVGYDFSGGDYDAAVWTSPDGDAWTRVPHDESVFGGASGQLISGVVVGGPGLVAVGYDFSGGDYDAAVWTSPDGDVWTRVPHDESVFGGRVNQKMNGVVVGGPGLVAVGQDDSGGDRDAAVWTSSDGVVWTRVPDDVSVFGGPDSQEILGVVVGGPGLVAVGQDDSGGDQDAAVWTSPDGVTWTRVSHDESVFGGTNDQAMVDVAAGGPGLVAVGYDFSGGDRDAAVWTSSDGVVWTRVPDDASVLGGPDSQVIERVAVGGSGLVAVGQDDSGGGWDATMWTSSDGFTWTRVPHDDSLSGGSVGQAVLGVVARGPGFVAVGEDFSDGDWDAAVWVSPPSG